jgi:DNA-binding transcriptional LysR family regulator
MEHRQLMNFLALCEERNFTRAAKKRFITQQGLSWSVRELEKELGAPLFDRGLHKNVLLTEYGAALERAARAYTNQHDYILETIRTMKEKSKSRLEIGLAGDLNLALPQRFLHNFITGHPDISLSIKTFPSDTLQQYVLEQRLQAAFSFPPFDENKFTGIPCGKEKIGLIAGKNHPLASRDFVPLQELRNWNVITFQTSRYPSFAIADICLQNGIALDTQFCSLDIAMVTELCETGRFVAFWGGPAPDPLKRIEIAGMEICPELYLLVNKQAFINDAVKTFIGYAQEKFGGGR